MLPHSGGPSLGAQQVSAARQCSQTFSVQCTRFTTLLDCMSDKVPPVVDYMSCDFDVSACALQYTVHCRHVWWN